MENGTCDDVEALWEKVECKRYELCCTISPSKLTPYLRQCKVLDEQDEDEILNSMLLVSKANRTSRLLDILHGKGERGYVAFLESLEFYYPELYKLVTGKDPTRRFSTIVVEEGHEGLTQFLMNEVVKLQQQSKAKTLQHVELSRKNCTLEDEQKKLRLVNQELQACHQRYNKLKEERNTYSDELMRVKDENYSIQSTVPEPPEKASLYRREREKEHDFLPRSLLDFDSDNMEMECEDELHRGPPSVHSSSSSHQSEGMDMYDLEQVNNIFRKLSLERPFRPSLSSFTRVSSSLKPVQELSLLGDNLLKDITLVGGNDSGIFISDVQQGSMADKAGLREGHHLLLIEGCIREENQSISLDTSTQEEAHWTLQHCSGPVRLHYRANFDSYRRLQSDLKTGPKVSGDSFYIRMNLNISGQSDSCSLSVHCDEVVHVLDTRHQGRCEWMCARVDPYSGCDQAERGTIPSNSRAQQLFLVKIQKLVCRGGKEENEMNRNRIFLQPEEASPSTDPKASPRMSRASIFLTQILQFVSRVDIKYKRMNSNERVRFINSGSTTLPRQGFETLRPEDAADPDNELSRSLNLIPYSPVTPQRTQRRRPVLFTPTALAKPIIQKILNMGGAMDFNICKPDTLSKEEFHLKQNVEPFIHYKEKHTTFECITRENIEAVASKDRHCLLEAQLSCVKDLLRRDIYPIIIHIKNCEKNVKKLRKLPLRLESEEEFVKHCRTKLKELENVPCLYASVEPEAWAGTDDLIKVIKDRILDEQKKVVWVEQDML